MTAPRPSSATVIGAGVAGLSCAWALAKAGVAVRVLDKGRSPGGRVATRRSRDGLAFDHGAQFATVRDPAFRAFCDSLLGDGTLGAWPAASLDEARLVGVPSMAAIGSAMAALVAAEGGHIVASRQAIWLSTGADGWRVRHADAETVRPGVLNEADGLCDEPCEALVIAIPPAQAGPLAATGGYRPELGGVTVAPCWTLMVVADGWAEAVDVIRPEGGPLGWIARESSKPGRAGQPDRWVAHATAEWSQANLELTPEAVEAELSRAWTDALGAAAPVSARAHRWRYAMTQAPLGADCLWDAGRRIGLCGDWCIGGRVEAAFLSGTALARTILGGGGA